MRWIWKETLSAPRDGQSDSNELTTSGHGFEAWPGRNFDVDEVKVEICRNTDGIYDFWSASIQPARVCAVSGKERWVWGIEWGGEGRRAGSCESLLHAARRVADCCSIASILFVAKLVSGSSRQSSVRGGRALHVSYRTHTHTHTHRVLACLFDALSHRLFQSTTVCRVCFGPESRSRPGDVRWIFRRWVRWMLLSSALTVSPSITAKRYSLTVTKKTTCSFSALIGPRMCSLFVLFICLCQQ